MPNVTKFVKPIAKLTKGQWERLLERIVLKQEGNMIKPVLPEAEAGGEVLNNVLNSEPVRTRIYGRVYQNIDLDGENLRQPKDYPWPEAVMRYLKANGELSAETRKLPEAKVFKMPREIPKEELGSALAPEKVYERRVYRPIQYTAKKIKPAVDEHKRELERAAASRLKQVKPVEKSLKKVTKGKVDLTKQTPETDQLVKNAITLDQMWKFIGGKRSYTGKLWDTYRKQARGRRKVKEARDYFYRVGLKWIEDPDRTAKIYPREVRSLETVWKEMMKAYGRFE